MSGHSHWAGIKHRKGVNDAKRATVFTKLARPITIAARDGGGNPDTNWKLRLAIDQARSFNMPKDNIDRAIKKGTGELKDGNAIEELLYDAYGPGNVALLIRAVTDSKNRAVSEIKSILTKGGGKMVPNGSVAYLFQEVGEILVDTLPEKREEMELLAIESGAEDTDYDEQENILAIYTPLADFQTVKDRLESATITVQSAEIMFRPLQKTTLSPEDHVAYDTLYEKLDDHPDVQKVYDNL